jgi:hypothetical protein
MQAEEISKLLAARGAPGQGQVATGLRHSLAALAGALKAAVRAAAEAFLQVLSQMGIGKKR